MLRQFSTDCSQRLIFMLLDAPKASPEEILATEFPCTLPDISLEQPPTLKVALAPEVQFGRTGSVTLSDPADSPDSEEEEVEEAEVDFEDFDEEDFDDEFDDDFEEELDDEYELEDLEVVTEEDLAEVEEVAVFGDFVDEDEEPAEPVVEPEVPPAETKSDGKKKKDEPVVEDDEDDDLDDEDE